MTRTTLGLAAAFLVACAGTDAPTAPADGKPSLRATTTTTKTTLDTTLVVFEPCANEEIELRIRQQTVEHTTTDPKGTVHFHFVNNDKGTKAVGLVTGRVWNQTGATVDHVNVSLAGTGNETFTNTLNLIGHGSAPNLKVKEVFHITVNRKGVVTVELERVRTLCR